MPALAASRPLHGGADRNTGPDHRTLEVVGRPLHGGADRNDADAAGVREPDVALCTGARIETVFAGNISYLRASRPLHGGADRNVTVLNVCDAFNGRPLHGGADRNERQSGKLQGRARRPLHGGADRNMSTDAVSIVKVAGRPLHGGADRNQILLAVHAGAAASPSARGRGSKPNYGEMAERGTASPSARGRGSKQPSIARIPNMAYVALCTGARIETFVRGRIGQILRVALCTGARIETVKAFCARVLFRRRPLHGGADRNARA